MLKTITKKKKEVVMVFLIEALIDILILDVQIIFINVIGHNTLDILFYSGFGTVMVFTWERERKREKKQR